MSSNISGIWLAVNFLKVEEKPLLGGIKACTLTFLLLTILLIGLLIQVRIFFMLRKQQNDQSMLAIDQLFKTHNYVNLVCPPAHIIYLIFSHYFYPMVDYIGLPGCVILSHFLMVFNAFYFLIFPVTIAIVRYLTENQTKLEHLY